jgi:hypothetical protein
MLVAHGKERENDTVTSALAVLILAAPVTNAESHSGNWADQVAQ